ncbi:hypothetical protein SAMN05518669_11027 [Variovorax sp. YR634]|uniref:hypothetical protein n=1 Tax=Variovorax sp. YR634 TaxID=1884385 RepID=UPI000895A8C0|nr:hypothetical protein [Variovorax sp. YR634]SDY19399.1 hypothetical protein SAMN05518669_11027 [Variovorax sp. YR634]
MTWGAIEPAENSASRLRLDFGLRPAILRFNEWAAPGLGGAFFVRQLSWGCMGLRLAQELERQSSAARIAEGIEALASWISVRDSAGRVEDDRVQGKRKFAEVSALSFDAVSRGGAYVTVPFRRAATRALPGLGFCHEEARFNALSLTQHGSELAEIAMADVDARARLVDWLEAGTAKIRRVRDTLRKSLLPEFATDLERALVHRQVLAHEGRRTIAGLLHQIPVDDLAGEQGRGRFLEGLPDPAMRARLATCFAFEDLRAASLAAAQEVSDAIHGGSLTAPSLAARAGVRARFGALEKEASALGTRLPQDAPAEAAAFCAEQAGGPLATRVLALCSRVPMIFSVFGERIDQGIGYTDELVADDPYDAAEANEGRQLPIPRPVIRLRRLLEEAGESFADAR